MLQTSTIPGILITQKQQVDKVHWHMIAMALLSRFSSIEHKLMPRKTLGAAAAMLHICEHLAVSGNPMHCVHDILLDSGLPAYAQDSMAWSE